MIKIFKEYVVNVFTSQIVGVCSFLLLTKTGEITTQSTTNYALHYDAK